MKKLSRCLGILILAGSMAAPAFAATGAPPVPMPDHQAMHGMHGGPGFHRCVALGQTDLSSGTYSLSALSADIGQGYLGPGRTDPLPPEVNGSGKGGAAPQVCCIIGSPEGPASS